ncbi:unnamed protein product [Camellia sinensis]
MRQSLGRISSPTIGNATKHNLIAFSSCSSNFEFTVPTTTTPAPPTPGDGDGDGDDNDPKGFPSGMGHGRCKPLLGTPILPSFSSFISSIVSSSGNNNTTTGRGRASAPPLQSEHEPKRPIFFSKEDATDLTTPSKIQIGNPPDSNLPSSILSVLSGTGRGKPSAKQLLLDDMPKEENCHLRSRHHTAIGRGQVSIDTKSSATPKLSREEAVKKAVGILSRGGVDVADRVEDGGMGTGSFRGRGTRGGGRGRGWRGRGRGVGRGGRGVQDSDDDYGAGLYLGDNADGEKLAKRIGPENMNKLVEGFEEMSGSVLPSPMDDAYLDALHTNFMIECEPEYLMEEFGTNPDIDEKPPIPLRDALEKMKPFLMAYEGIQSQEEWEEVVKETMEKVPVIKELVDHYSGPDRVTAKKQQEELERVAKTLPQSAPASVKRFTDRAILSLQLYSWCGGFCGTIARYVVPVVVNHEVNPGWGFDRKCQFMDKLVWEVSQHYKWLSLGDFKCCCWFIE